jgi:heat shock protein HslJ
MKSTRAALAAAFLAGAVFLGACAAPAVRQPAGEASPGVAAPAPEQEPLTQQENPQMPSHNDQGAAGQGSPFTQEAPGLGGSSWTLTDLDGTAPLADAVPTLQFATEGRVAGRASCNRYMGGYRVDGPALSFTPLAGTRMACPQPQMEQEQAFLAILQRAASYTLGGDTLTITADDGATLVFTRA